MQIADYKQHMIRFLLLIILVQFTVASCIVKSGQSEVYSDPNVPLIQLPTEFKTLRQNGSATMMPGDFYDILNAKGPGCVRSIWLLRAEGKRIEILVDGAEFPQVSMPAPNFFGTLLGLEPYHINSAGFVAMPNEWVRSNFGGGEPAYTCYLPMPFQDSIRIRMHADTKGGLSTMVNWHKYDYREEVTPYRFYAVRNVLNPAPYRGYQMQMADISGAGFIAGIFTGIKQLSFDDLMYHQGGITWLIDGETAPHAIRGVNLEDDYGFSWGFHNTQTPWFGVPYFKVSELENPVYQTPIYKYQQEGVVFRFMGPDPVSFSSSISMKTGTRPDHVETVIYYYKKIGTTAAEIATPNTWQIAGTVPCKSKEEFESEIPTTLLSDWQDSIDILDEKYAVQEQASDHGWLNFNSVYIAPHWTPSLTEQAVYAKGTVMSSFSGKATLRLAFDDWISVWVNGGQRRTIYHESEFKSVEIPVTLLAGGNEILIKSVNFNNIPNNRLWAINLVVID